MTLRTLAQARLWISCVTGAPLPAMSMQQTLRSGEVLCDLANALQQGVVPKVRALYVAHVRHT